MTRNEFTTLFKRIESEFSNFTADYDEWYKVLSNYSYNEVLNNLKKYKGDTPPIYLTLIKNLKEEEKIDDWITCCDICKQRFRIVNNDLEEFEKHHRKCQKIDFIDRMSMRLHKKHIASVVYYEMSDDELNKAYRQVMDYYVAHRDNTKIFKKIPQE